MLPRAIRTLLIGIVIAMPSAICSAQDSTSYKTSAIGDTTPAKVVPYTPLTFNQKASVYSSRTFSFRAILGASYAAGLAQWRGTPQEWGAGLSGYARRDAAAYGGGIIRHTTEFGVGALLREDPRFEASTHDGLWPRTGDALRRSVLIRTDDGGHHFAWSRVVASLATGFAVNSWEPKRLHSPHHAFMLSLVGFTSYITGSVTQEFTPDVKHFLLRGTRFDDR
jgi:hypothetical protein